MKKEVFLALALAIVSTGVYLGISFALSNIVSPEDLFVARITLLVFFAVMVFGIILGWITERPTKGRKKFDPQKAAESIIGGERVATLGELRKRLRPWLRMAMEIVVEPADEPDDAAMLSHYGGQPYFEKGDEWPKGSDGNPLYFVCQYFNDGTLPISKDIKLVQLFFSTARRNMMESKDNNFIKVWRKLEPKNMVKIAPPDVEAPTHTKEEDFFGKKNDMSLRIKLSEIVPYQTITFKPIKTMPHITTMDNLLEGEKGFGSANNDLVYDEYEMVVNDLTGEGERGKYGREYIGGWAELFQDDIYIYEAGYDIDNRKSNNTPKRSAEIYKKMQKLELLFWGAWWGNRDAKRYDDFSHDDGCGYIIYNPETKKAIYGEDGT
jgi:hypothetical protein